jgi:hypothetical protein
MKMMDMRTKTELKKMEAPKMMDQDRWPYGLRLTLEQDQVKKFPELAKGKVGGKVMVHGIAEITSIRQSERQSGENQHTVELQIKEMGCEVMKAKKEEHESMGMAMDRAKENHRA